VNEEERAKKLSDAVDALLQGGQPELDLDDDELIELLRLARRRHRVGQGHVARARASQELVWRVLEARLLASRTRQATETNPHP
jgi:hypothetical protein